MMRLLYALRALQNFVILVTFVELHLLKMLLNIFYSNIFLQTLLNLILTIIL